MQEALVSVSYYPQVAFQDMSFLEVGLKTLFRQLLNEIEEVGIMV